jgi:hypothetical protein
MPSLSREPRRLLERTIAGADGARKIAEAGAEQSLQRLAVDRHEPHTSLTIEERTLRNQLRAHGRQLGDKRDLQRGTQTIEHLKQAVAYEHWHRLLFARFLAENDLLMHPGHGVSLTLDEVKELAIGEGRDWIELAAEYAQRMLLREVFRSDDPALRVPLSPEKRRDLEAKLNLLPREIFLADDSLGWVYQFWQEDAKDEVNRSEVKIGADELSPVTQLFTEDYMVLFLLENTLGSWWTAQRGTPDLPGYTWTYLRLNDDGSPAAGSYDEWPKSSKELKILDPCMGSGHFLTFALPILAHMREAEEGLSPTAAIAAVLRDNLFGLELDPRCSQIAAFNLALTAWKLARQHFELPPLNLACSGMGINTKEDDWVKLAGEDGLAGEGMRRLYSLFKDAPTLGSLIDPLRLKANVFAAGSERIIPFLEQALKNESTTEDSRELVIAAQGVLVAYRILASQFTLIATNVPYLGRGKQAPLLAQYCAEFHSDAKADLATCFVDRCLHFTLSGGSVALVTPQNWLFLPGYSALRKRLLSRVQFDAVVRLGANAFQDMNFWAATTALTIITGTAPAPDHRIYAVDASTSKDQSYKRLVLRGIESGFSSHVEQLSQVKNPDARISLEPPSRYRLLSHFAITPQGMKSGDDFRYRRRWWEIDVQTSRWRFLQGAPDSTRFVEGSCFALDFLAGETEFARPQGRSAWGKEGVVVKLMGGITAARYFGEVFDSNVTAIVPHDKRDLPALWAYISSPEFSAAIRSIEQAVKVNNATVGKVPFDIDYWRDRAKEAFPLGLPKPEIDDARQWSFHGSPNGCEQSLQVAVARVLGYKWPRQLGISFPQCDAVATDRLEPHNDGIMCLSALVGEESAASQLRMFLRNVYGESFNLAFLLEGKKSATLEEWLRDEFFIEHIATFDQRPFVWHIWDGLKDGFHALVNYQKLDRRNLEKLIFSYLGDWLTRQRQDVQSGVEGADTRLAAGEHLQGELKKILEGEEPYDIFVRWKPLHEQPIGWEPDLSDGIRMNIRPWITEAKLYKATRPGILRVLPNLRFTKDRGKEPVRDPSEFPWFAKSKDRINDHHLSLAEKRRGRGLS